MPRLLEGPAVPISSLVLSGLAVLVAASGTAVAVATVGAADIRSGAVRSTHIRDGQVTSSDLADGRVRGVDVRNGTLSRADLAPSARSLAGLRLVQAESTQIGAEDDKFVLVECPTGTYAIGGGGALSGPVSAAITETFPATFNDDVLPRGWWVRAHETAPVAIPWRIYGYATCAPAG